MNMESASTIARGRWLATISPREVRRACGISQQTIAMALGVSQAMVSKWESGLADPSGERGAAYCRVVAGLLRHLDTAGSPGLSGEVRRLQAYRMSGGSAGWRSARLHAVLHTGQAVA